MPEFPLLLQILGGFAPEQKETTPPSDSPASLPEPERGLKCLIPEGAVCRRELLGSGCFGVVHRGLWTLPNGQSVSIRGSWHSCPLHSLCPLCLAFIRPAPGCLMMLLPIARSRWLSSPSEWVRKAP